MNRMTALGLGVSLILVTAMGCDKKDDKAPVAGTPGSTTAAPAGAPAAIPAEPIVTTPQALVKEFVDDAKAAAAKYPRLTPFKITGVVAGFGIDALKLKSEDKDDQLAVDCAFTDPASQAKIKAAKRGDKFTVVGKFNTYDQGSKMVELISCKLAD